MIDRESSGLVSGALTHMATGASVCILLLSSSPALAQTTPAEGSPWKVSFGGGLALTTGNKDTTTVNASYDVTYSPHPRRTFKSDALLLRGRTDGEISNERFGVNLREEYRVGNRIFVFGQGRYLRDRFKRIQYLVAPTGGIGVTAVRSDTTTLAIDVGLGGVWEKNPYASTRASGALTVSQKLTQAISDTTTLTQSVSGLWRTQDLRDAIYQFGATVALSVNSHIQLKIELIDSYSNRPTGDRTEKNDVSTVIAIAFRN